MNLIIDFHTHSHFSRATSKDCTLEGLYKWGKIKGINVIGTGDFTHPAWFTELQEKLESVEDGLWKLRDDIAQEIDKDLPESVRNNIIRFVLTVEISNIYSKYGKVRKVHNVIIAPNFHTVQEINTQLSSIGNLRSDGRPILGLDSKELLNITLKTHPDNLFIPAHIWTPWFGMFGSKSGFDSLVETFDELTPEIKAIETGLSSDPYMNWRVKELQHIAITSHSDAHSPQKLGREATVMNCDLSYHDIVQGIKRNDSRLAGTIEFFPAEGKYHEDGHRSCNVHFTPAETKQHNGICPVCSKPVTIGVQYRVDELAQSTLSTKIQHTKTVEYIIPLIEILAEMNGVKSATKSVQHEYEKIYSTLGNEFSVLRTLSIDDIESQGFPELAHTIQRMRIGDVYIESGYDGVYGTVRLFSHENERNNLQQRLPLL